MLEVDDFVEIGEVGEEVALDTEGDGRVGRAGDFVEEVGIRVVLKRVGAGEYVEAGVKVFVGNVAGGAGVREDIAKPSGGLDQGIQIILFRGGGGDPD